MSIETPRMNDVQISNSVYIRDFTGNPFVDAGIATLCILTGKKDSRQISKADLTAAIQQITEFYLEDNEIKWQNLGKLFTINCILLNPSNRENRRRKYEEYLRELIQKVTPASSSGNCIACGARDAQPLLHGHMYRYPYRDEYPLAGSGEMLNYFSFFDLGVPLCPLCTLALQFMPLYLISNNRQLFLSHSHNRRIMLDLAKESLILIKGNLAAGAELTFPRPFLFSNINECVIKIVRHLMEKAAPYNGYGPTTIRLYSFVNSGQRNLFDFIDLPTEVFIFLEKAWLGGMKDNLNELFEESTGMTKSGRDIYSCLVDGDDVSYPFFLRKRERRIVGGWELLESYLLEVKKMEREKIEAVKRVGKRLYECLKAKNDFKKLRDLETDDYSEFKLALERFQKEKLIYEIDDLPLLFPKDEKGRVFWRETQNLLLGYIYELMHKEAKEVKI